MEHRVLVSHWSQTCLMKIAFKEIKLSVTNIVTQSFAHQSNAIADSFHKAIQVAVAQFSVAVFTGCPFYHLPHFCMTLRK